MQGRFGAGAWSVGLLSILFPVPFCHVCTVDMSFGNVQFSPEERARLKEEILSHTVKGPEDCVSWGGTLKGGYGIWKVRLGDKRTNVRVHRFLFYLESGCQELDQKMHVSHLCHRKNCIKLEHLSLEDNVTNNQRKTCVLEGRCFGHVGYDYCLGLVCLIENEQYFQS